MSYAIVDDVEDRMGRTLSTAERELAAVLLRDVEVIIKSRIKDFDLKVTSGDIDLDVVIFAECAAVKRVILNSEGFLQETDGNYSYTRDSGVASGLLELTDREWAMLGGSAGMFTIQPEWWNASYPRFDPFGSTNAQWFGPPSWQWYVRPL